MFTYLSSKDKEYIQMEEMHRVRNRGRGTELPCPCQAHHPASASSNPEALRTSNFGDFYEGFIMLA